MLTAIGLGALCTGDVSAAGEEEVVEQTKWLGLSVIGWISAALTAGFGVGTFLLRDFRLVGATIVMAIITALIVHFGI